MGFSVAAVAVPALTSALDKVLDIPSDHYRTKRHRADVDGAVTGAALTGGVVVALVITDEVRHARQIASIRRALREATAAEDQQRSEELQQELISLSRRISLPRHMWKLVAKRTGSSGRDSSTASPGWDAVLPEAA